jgi:hypothetical protein
MRLDIRLPIGLLFSIFGVVLVAYGAFGNHDIYAKSLGHNVNLIWGGVLLVFGLLMLLSILLHRSRTELPIPEKEPEYPPTPGPLPASPEQRGTAGIT